MSGMKTMAFCNIYFSFYHIDSISFLFIPNVKTGFKSGNGLASGYVC